MIKKLLSLFRKHESPTSFFRGIPASRYYKLANDINNIMTMEQRGIFHSEEPKCECPACRPDLYFKDDRGIWVRKRYQSLGDEVV